MVIDNETLARELIEHQIQIEAGINYPNEPPPENVVRALREQGVELPNSGIEAVKKLFDAVSRVQLYCDSIPMKYIEITDHSGERRKILHLYRCHHPKLGTFFMYIEKDENDETDSRWVFVKITRSEGEALEYFAKGLSELMDRYDALTLEQLEKTLRDTGMFMGYNV